MPALAWDREELGAWLRLVLTPSVGPGTARKLLAQFGSPQAVWDAPTTALADCVTAAQATQLAQVPEAWQRTLDATWQWLHDHDDAVGHALITLGDPRYPDSLLHTADPPLMLYAMGPQEVLQRDAPWLAMERSLAVVGSRNPTPQGADHAHRFAHHLAAQGWCVVSGMALGIDAAAHTGALDSTTAGLATVAVVGTGIERVYPRQHHALAHRIAQRGLVISELPLGTPPIAANFPKRNRIIAGLTRGTLVVEAALASGSLITARLASEQGREVFAIPGSIHSPQSRGCHALIRQGAKLVESAQDILEEWSDTAPLAAPPTASSPAAPATAALHPLLDAMGHDPVGLEALSARTGWDAARLQAQLLELELDGWVAHLPGGRYQRTGLA